MNTEIEAKFLDIDTLSFRKALKEKGANLIYSERPMKRKIFDYPDSRLKKIGGWIRVRYEGDKTTLSYKHLLNRTLEGTKEILVVVNDFNRACNLLLAVGFKNTSYQETKREKWKLGNVEITIDTWPWIPTFVEIEGSSEKELKKIVAKLGLDWSKALYGSVENAYQAYYSVTESEVDSWENIVFSPIPNWLKTRKK